MTRMQSIKNNLIGDRQFYKKTTIILIPILIEYTLSNMVNLIDNIMVGKLGTLQISAVAISNQLLAVFAMTLMGGISGVGIFTSQFTGANDNKGIQNTFKIKYYICAPLFIAAFVIFAFFPDKLMGLYLAKDSSAQDVAETLMYGRTYMHIMLLQLLPYAVIQIYSSTLAEMGKTKLPMLATSASIVTNIIFNYIFIFGNEGLHFLWFGPMGVKGAAIATIISRYIGMLILVIAVHANSSRYKFIKGIYRSLKVPVSLLKDTLRKGFPLLINELLWSYAWASLTQCYSIRGIKVVAATNIAVTIGNICQALSLAVGYATAVIVGQQLGANRIKEAKTTAWRLMALSVTICIITGALLFVISPLIPQIYNIPDDVRTLATALLRIICVLLPVSAISKSCYFTLRSGGKTLITMLYDSGSIWFLNLASAYIIGNFTSMPIIPFYLISQGLEIVKAAIGIIFVKSGFWIKNIVADNVENDNV